MARDIFTIPDVMDKMVVIRIHEEGRYSDIRKWSGEIEEWTEKAVLLRLDISDQPPARQRWIPFSHLRKAADGQSIYASIWILDKKGL